MSFYLVAIDIFTCRRKLSGLNLQYGTYLIPRGCYIGGNFVLVSRGFCIWEIKFGGGGLTFAYTLDLCQVTEFCLKVLINCHEVL